MKGRQVKEGKGRGKVKKMREKSSRWRHLLSVFSFVFPSFVPFPSFSFLFLPFPSFSFLFLPFPSFFLCFCSILLVGWSKLQKFFACGRPLYFFTLLSENSKIFFSLRSKTATAPFINTQKSIFIQ